LNETSAKENSLELQRIRFTCTRVPLARNGKAAGALLVVIRHKFIDSRVLLTLRDALLTALLQTLLVSGLAQLLFGGPFFDP
jgi:hypothetical protein